MSKIKILLVDDHQIFREGIRVLLEKRDNLEVVGEAPNGRAAHVLTAKLHPDIILMDVSMPDMNGVEATRRIKDDFPNVKVVGLSMHVEQRFIMEMLKAGASGFLPKHCDFNELISAIDVTAKGQTYLSPTIAGDVVDGIMHQRLDTSKSAYKALTAREREIVQLLSEGMSSKEVAEKLSLSVKTVHTHRQNIMDKLGINSIAELTKYALQEGLTSL